MNIHQGPQASSLAASQFAPPGGPLKEAIAGIARCDFPLLIIGERGVGKRSLAAHIHRCSPRSRQPFVNLASAGLEVQALAAALDSGGAIYLAEVGDLPIPCQAFLVDSLQASFGKAPSRLFSGTSRDLWEDVRALRLREDFYYLISPMSIQVPPLRHRKTEILALAESFLARYAKQFDRAAPVLDEETIDYLTEHSWPENLRELQKAVQTLVIVEDRDVSLAALKATAVAMRSHGRRQTLKQAVRTASTRVERELISQVLQATGGNRKRAANQLGISYRALLYKIKQADAGPEL